LNLAAGQDEAELSAELFSGEWEDYQFPDSDPPERPIEIAGLLDNSDNVVFIDLLADHEANKDPMRHIAEGLERLDQNRKILLLRHLFDPVPLRELFARKGFASWAEERRRGQWYIYFYRPREAAGVRANPPVSSREYQKFFSMAA
jgi:hypothetical protein